MGLNLSELHNAVVTHGPLTRILIADHKGSTPRDAGTSMLVWADGQSGTIGGGALEQQVTDFARTVDKPTAINIPLGPALGQCCGGNVVVVFEPFSIKTLPTDAEAYIRRINGESDRPLALKKLRKSIHNSGQNPDLVWLDGWLFEPLSNPKTSLWVYGAGHVGRAIVDTFDGLPFDIKWVDTSADRFPSFIPQHADRLIANKPTNVVKYAPDTAHHVVLTYSHALDLDLCHAILSRPFSTLGLIGSATKRARFSSKLIDLGHTPAQISSIICPIGQRQLGKTPKAIAIGLAAELLGYSAISSADKKAIT
jgi:xanthine dehydrogenase accessory factor